jgi:hypothetical protein
VFNKNKTIKNSNVKLKTQKKVENCSLRTSNVNVTGVINKNNTKKTILEV